MSNMNFNSSYKRPDIADLLGPEFDSSSPEPARRTLIICASPRTGSFELCRHLTAAGIGMPHEYFNQAVATRLGLRWGLGLAPLAETSVERYIETLRRKRAQSGVFATKVMFYQFDQNLRNSHGAALFEGADVVHLYRTDIERQYTSLRIAMQTGRWDFSDRQMGQMMLTVDRKMRDETAFDQSMRILDFLVEADAGFRRLFTLFGVCPLFVTSDELFENPRGVVHRIAETLRTPLNEAKLDESIAHGGAYRKDTNQQRTLTDFSARFKEIAFKRS